tara:strand:- start:2343 stop:2792 length:450 start_codon:yes stop_codon:yes gene_type:complete
MSVLTKIDGIPLFKDRRSALLHGLQFGIKGVHTHVYNGITGYMAGTTHELSIAQMVSSGNADPETLARFNQSNVNSTLPLRQTLQRTITPIQPQQVRIPVQPQQPQQPVTRVTQQVPLAQRRRRVVTPTYSSGGMSSGGGSGGGGGGGY